ncbi:MAG: UDP-glucose 4-epimerase GalE [Desulfobacterales bacterium]|nr:UDP-glucose 4-epimerase GalE [Desulfobacterales bacterium]
MSHILVIGGAGYIGSHVCKCLSRAGHEPVVLDNLVHGHEEAVKWGPFYKGSMEDAGLLDRVFSSHRIAGVMHFAAYCYVGESVERPGMYYRNNVSASLTLLEAMQKHGVRPFIFSSSCATYGEPEETPITESHPQNPVNPYGRTKLVMEWMMADFGRAHGLNAAALRYFNAAGADPDGELGEDHRPETHLIPIVLQTALGQRERVEIFGDDFDTPDGTCIRDYIHVFDLAQAHLLALERLLNGLPGDAYNLGNGQGHSVKEVVETARRVTGKPIPSRIAPIRPGDPSRLVGSSEKAARVLGWKPRFADLDAIIQTAWDWLREHPGGY